MGFWLHFWTVVFVLALVLFTGLAVVVSLGGYADIRSMLRRLSGDDSQPPDS